MHSMSRKSFAAYNVKEGQHAEHYVNTCSVAASLFIAELVLKLVEDEELENVCDGSCMLYSNALWQTRSSTTKGQKSQFCLCFSGRHERTTLVESRFCALLCNRLLSVFDETRELLRVKARKVSEMCKWIKVENEIAKSVLTVHASPSILL